MRKLIPFVALVTLMALILPGQAMAQAPNACEFEYTVQAGDWLSKIAEKYFGDPLSYPTIVEANNSSTDDNFIDIANPDLIEPGWLLCIPPDGNPAMSPQAAPEGLSAQELANTTYKSEYTQDGTAPLTNGEYSEPAAPGSASMVKVMLTDNIAYGELNGQPAAAVVLVSDPGGSGTFYDLAVVVNQDGQPVNVATTFLGDRLEINSIAIENNQIVIDMVQAGPDDPLCCPSQHVIKTYELQGDQLVETFSQEVAQSDSGLAGSSWVLTSVNGQAAVPDAPATITFNEDGTASGTTGCNQYNLGYEINESNITFGLGPMTLMACPDPIGQQENAFMAALGATATYQVQGDTLELLDADGNVVVTFSRMAEASLPGSSWTVISYNNGNQAVVSVIIGTELTANFGEDGTLSGSAGCNNYMTSYEVNGDNITIGPAATTRMACGEPDGIMEQEQQYLAALQTASTYKIELDRMEMRTAEGSMVANFQRAK